jgi:predicted RNA-binding protein with TRAM domain
MSRDWIVQTSVTTGTGTYTLGDPPLGTSYFPFRQRISNGATDVRYWVVNADRTKWEKNAGCTLTYGVSPGTDTLTRNVLESTNGDAPVSWVSGDMPLRVYIAPDSAVEEGVLEGFLGATRATQLKTGGRWWDRAAGLAVSWIDKFATGIATDVRVGVYDAVKALYFADGRRAWTAVGAANKTIAAADIGGIFTQNNSAAARTFTLPDHAATGIKEGFRVGGLGLTAGGQYGIVLTPAAGDGIDGGADGVAKTIPGGVRFDVVWDEAGDTWRVEYLNTPPAVRIPRRQTVASGPRDSNGHPNFLPSTETGLTLTTAGGLSSNNLIVTAANGWTPQGIPNDRIAVASANFSWTGLTASRAAATPNFLHVTVNADGTLTSGHTILAPIYQWAGTPSVTNGQFTFNISEMKGYMGNGTTAVESFIVFVGEAATDGSNVISTVEYAYNGLYDSGFTATLPTPGTPATANHNLGIHPRAKEMVIECTTIDITYAVGSQISTAGGLQTADTEVLDIPVIATRNTVSAGALNGGSWYALYADLSNRGTLTPASWKYKFTADRGW